MGDKSGESDEEVVEFEGEGSLNAAAPVGVAITAGKAMDDEQRE